MSKRLLSFFLSELQTIRIHCPNASCGGVVELPIKQLATHRKGIVACPVCGTASPLNNKNLIQIGLELEALAKANVDVEFVLPDTDRPAAESGGA
jgi:hypothetical protein